MRKDVYRFITEFKIEAECVTPLHIGGNNNSGEVLIHPVDGRPFIQASSISGVLRRCFADLNCNKETDKEKVKEKEAKIFGGVYTKKNQDGKTQNVRCESCLKVTDGQFVGNVLLELRPRLSINPETGTCEESIVKGTDIKSGNKFNMEYIGAGAKFNFNLYLYEVGNESDATDKNSEIYENKERYFKVVTDLFYYISENKMSLGGQRSNGCGDISFTSVKYKTFDMKNEDDRNQWLNHGGYGTEELRKIEYKDLSVMKNSDNDVSENNAYVITVLGKTENKLLIKGIEAEKFGVDVPKAENIKNAKDEFIVPGSSMKGAFRSQIDRICRYLYKDDSNEYRDIIDSVFGSKEKTGNIRFFDTIVGNIEENEKVDLSYRIHIDKFTGGVMNGSLFSEKNVYGDMNIKITISDRNNPEISCGLIILALRDMAMGMMNLGSGYGVGKGFVKVNEIKIRNKNGNNAIIRYDNKRNVTITDEKKIINKCITSLSK